MTADTSAHSLLRLTLAPFEHFQEHYDILLILRAARRLFRAQNIRQGSSPHLHAKYFKCDGGANEIREALCPARLKFHNFARASDAASQLKGSPSGTDSV